MRGLWRSLGDEERRGVRVAWAECYGDDDEEGMVENKTKWAGLGKHGYGVTKRIVCTYIGRSRRRRRREGMGYDKI